jgi:hypothetical protein
MIITLKKFGDILTSREEGREALLAFSPTLQSIGKNEEIIIDFEGVSVLTPSWADEFLRPILFLKKYAKKVSMVNDTNASVQAALRFANPKIDWSKITVDRNSIVFHEIISPLTSLLFPCTDEEARDILIENKVKSIKVKPAEFLKDDSRLDAVIKTLNQAGITTISDK